MTHSRMALPAISRVLVFLLLASITGLLPTFGPIHCLGAQASAERVLENKIPKHLPIKVRLRKEQTFKDLKNESWLRELELELTNIGDKPIYSLGLLIGLPEIAGPDGHNVGFSLRYGRSELLEIKSKAEADDIPINPGETYVFRLRDNEVRAWEVFRKKEGKSDATKVILRFQVLSFGDGTGFLGYDGKAVPSAPDEQ